MFDKVRGEATGVLLDHVAPLLLPWTQDPWGALRPPLSVDALRLSVELAAATYHMDTTPWVQAGWRDITIQVDNELVTDLQPSREAGTVAKLAASWRMHHVRAKLRQQNPIGQVMGAFRQRNGCDTGKVLVMLHPAPLGRYVVAISFMGTGSRFYDWFSNFRMSSEDGAHQGFLQLARQFEGNEVRIRFPQTAAELGLENLTLHHILQEAAHPDSRFLLWLTGHSQGGAIMQVWTHLKFQEGVLLRNMVGYGFASPSAFEGWALPHPERYPLYHVLNGDDVVPRMGAQAHLGVCLYYPTDDSLRSQCYMWPRTPEAETYREKLQPLVERMEDTPSCIVSGLAYLEALAEESPEDMITGIGVLGMDRLPLGRMLNAADKRIEDLMRFIRRHITAAYQSITGHKISTAELNQVKGEIAALIQEIGVKAFAATLTDMMSWPHSVHAKKGAYMGAYPYIALYGMDKLCPFIWEGGSVPQRHWAGRITGATQAPTALVVRRRIPAPRKERAGKRYSQRRK